MKQVLCKGISCSNNCCLEFSGISDRLTPFDSSIHFSDIILSQDEYDNLIMHGYQQFVDVSNNKFRAIKTSEDGVCSAFLNGKCQIYDLRPALCKAYPFYIDMFAGLCVINDCEAVPKECNMTNYTEAISSAISAYKNWIYYYERELEKVSKHEELTVAKNV